MRLPLGVYYLAGPGGVQILWPDGTCSSLQERTVVRLERQPRRVIGPLLPLHAGRPAYEAPRWKRFA